MKKMLAVLLTATMTLGMLAGCGSKDSGEGGDASSESDKAYVQDKGTLVIGITDFAPMDYKDENGDWIGFDADMAKAFAESLGVEAEFVEIDWDNKILELDGKTIDCVWNGMTLTDEVTSSMACTDAYLNNAQVVVVPADVADQYQDEESLSELNFAVEAGSAGEAEVSARELELYGGDRSGGRADGSGRRNLRRGCDRFSDGGSHDRRRNQLCGSDLHHQPEHGRVWRWFPAGFRPGGGAE